jgi:hypothetical protein
MNFPGPIPSLPASSPLPVLIGTGVGNAGFLTFRSLSSVNRGTGGKDAAKCSRKGCGGLRRGWGRAGYCLHLIGTKAVGLGDRSLAR